MADEQFYTILTNVGKAKVANATLLNSNVTLKTLKVGDSNGNYYNPTEEQTVLKNTVYSCDVGSVQADKDNPNWIIVETVIPGSVGGFTIREIGLFDVEGDLIAVGKYPETYKPVVANGASKDLCIRTIFEVSNTESVTLSLNPSVIIATRDDINNLQKQIDENRASLNANTQKIKDISDNIKPYVVPLELENGWESDSALPIQVIVTGNHYDINIQIKNGVGSRGTEILHIPNYKAQLTHIAYVIADDGTIVSNAAILPDGSIKIRGGSVQLADWTGKSIVLAIHWDAVKGE